MSAFRFSQFLRREGQGNELNPEREQPMVEPPLDASPPVMPNFVPTLVREEQLPSTESHTEPEDRLGDDRIKNLRGLDNIIKELGMEADDKLISGSKFFAGCRQLEDMLIELESPEECELTWSEICKKVEQFGLAIEEEFGAFWIEALDADFEGLEYFWRRHNINACTISLKLAQALKYKQSELLSIAASVLLYNVGSPREVQGNLSQEEQLNQMDRSVNILKKTGAPADMLRAVSECNERVDGSGTPRGLQSAQISLKGQLLGMAVTFEQLFRKEQASFKEQGTAFQPVVQMLKIHRNHFNPQVLKSLLLTSGFYQVGAIVELNSGSLARVITQNPGAPLRPLIEVVLDRAGNHPVHRQIIDLRDNLTLSIVRTVAKGT